MREFASRPGVRGLLRASIPVELVGTASGRPGSLDTLTLTDDEARIRELDKALAAFVDVMREKLIKNIHKKEDWKEINLDFMWRRMLLEVEELKLAMDHETPLAVQKECADVANFLMFIHHRMNTEQTKRGSLRG